MTDAERDARDERQELILRRSVALRERLSAHTSRLETLVATLGERSGARRSDNGDGAVTSG